MDQKNNYTNILYNGIIQWRYLDTQSLICKGHKFEKCCIK